MKYLLLLLLTATILTGTDEIQAQDNSTADYNIKFQIDGVTGDRAILAYYYMDKKYIKDTIDFDQNGFGQIKGEYDLPTGVYLMAFPSLNLTYFELILGEERDFKMKSDTADLVDQMTVTGSTENKIFYDNMRFLIAQGKISNNLKEQAKDLDRESEEYLAIHDMLVEMDSAVKARRAKLIKDYPNAFYTKIVMAMAEIVLPENPDPTDSSFAYRYYQEHYFDNVDFSDSRLIRTPFLLRKITTFLDDYTIPVPDSINANAERIIEYSKADYEMFQFCLVGIFNKYAKSKIMSHELVYVNLAKKYYLSGEADWTTEEQLNTFKERIGKMEPTLLGKKAPQIILSDIDDKVTILHEVSPNGYTVLTFWNSSCGHCKKEMPKLKEIYQSELVPLGNIKILAISTELETDEWKKFIDEHKLIADGWIHAHDPKGSNPFRYLYNIESTPLVLVLDPDNKILAKRINIDDIKNLIDFDMRNRAKQTSEN